MRPVRRRRLPIRRDHVPLSAQLLCPGADRRAVPLAGYRLSELWRFARDFRPGAQNLLLFGDPGLGKTFLSACIARVVSEDGFSVVYDTAGHIFAQFEASKFRRDDVDEPDESVERCMACDLLILDDLGTEMTTAFVQSALYQLLNSRLLAGRSTIISTNLDPDQIGRRYSAQIMSRLEGEFELLPFIGQDIRRLKREQQR